MEELKKIAVVVIFLSLIVSSLVCFGFFYFYSEELKGETGAQGPKGSQGSSGIGEIPAHEWQDTSIRFQNSDGSWGKWVDLQGEKGIGERGIGEIPAHEWQDTSIRFQNSDGSWGKWVDLQGERGESIVGPPGPEGPIGPQGERYVIGNRWQRVKKWDLNDLQGKKAQSFETNYDIGKVKWSISSSYKTPELIITIYKCTENGKLIYPAYVVIKGSALEKSGEYWLLGAGHWSISIYVQRVQRLEIEVLQLTDRNLW